MTVLLPVAKVPSLPVGVMSILTSESRAREILAAAFTTARVVAVAVELSLALEAGKQMGKKSASINNANKPPAL